MILSIMEINTRMKTILTTSRTIIMKQTIQVRSKLNNPTSVRSMKNAIILRLTRLIPKYHCRQAFQQKVNSSGKSLNIYHIVL